MLHFYPKTIPANASLLVTFKGPPNRVVKWVLLEGEGLLAPISPSTDSEGYALARYIPNSYTGSTKIQVQYVA